MAHAAGMGVGTGTYRIAEIDPADRYACDASFEIQRAARAYDLPDFPRPCRHSHDAGLRAPWPGYVEPHWMAFRGDRPAGVGSVSLPQVDNLDNAWCEIFVHPDHRRQGAGRALYDQIVAYARGAGRIRLMADTIEALPGGHERNPAGSAFARTMGMENVLGEVRRTLDLSTADTSGYEWMLADAWRRADGYSLVQWRDRAPEEYVADIAYLDGRLHSDAPMGELEWAPEDIDADRMRRMEEARLAHGARCYTSAVRHDASGRVVAVTALMLEKSVPEHAWQLITLVDPPHRGHRLGTIVKIANLRYATAAEPALRLIDTWNAAVNDHMISINEAVGFRPMDSLVNWQQKI
jgi:GNAT superfamily N-acetyltransferase